MPRESGAIDLESKTSARVYYLDWLRVLGVLAVLVYHSSRFFNVEEWMVKNPIWYPWVEVWNRFAVIWLMPLMFVISGASLFYALGKGGGAGKFVKDKVLRLLVPLVVGALTLSSVQVYLERLTHGQFGGTYFQFLPHYFQGTYDGSNPASGNFAWLGMHLWYLLVLFVFSLAFYPLMRWMKGRGYGVLSRLGGLLALPGAFYALVLPTILLSVLVNPDSPAMTGNAGWPFLQYGWFILAGFFVLSDERVHGSVLRLRWLSLALAVASSVAFLFLSFRLEPSFGTPLYALVAGLRAVAAWCWVMASLGLAMRYLVAGTPFLRYANEAVLPFYILHQTVLLSVGYFVVQLAIPSLLRWAIILPASFAVIMVLYEFLVRRFNVLRFLFGMKPLARRPAARPRVAVAGR